MANTHTVTHRSKDIIEPSFDNKRIFPNQQDGPRFEGKPFKLALKANFDNALTGPASRFIYFSAGQDFIPIMHATTA